MGDVSIMPREAIPWERIHEYVLTCGEVHDPYKFCVTALENIRDLVPFDQGLFLMFDGNRRISRRYFLDFPERWSSIYLEYYSRTTDNEFSLNRDLGETPGEPFVNLIDWSAIAGGSQDDFIRHYIRARGLRYSLSFVFFDLNGAPATAFSLDRVWGSAFRESEINNVRIAVAHLNNLYKNLPGQRARGVRERPLPGGGLGPRDRHAHRAGHGHAGHGARGLAAPAWALGPSLAMRGDGVCGHPVLLPFGWPGSGALRGWWPTIASSGRSGWLAADPPT